MSGTNFTSFSWLTRNRTELCMLFKYLKEWILSLFDNYNWIRNSSKRGINISSAPQNTTDLDLFQDTPFMTLRLAVFLGERVMIRIWDGFLWNLSNVLAAFTFPSLINSLRYSKARTSIGDSFSISHKFSNLSIRGWILSFPCMFPITQLHQWFFLSPTLTLPLLGKPVRAGQNIARGVGEELETTLLPFWVGKIREGLKILRVKLWEFTNF